MKKLAVLLLSFSFYLTFVTACGDPPVEPVKEDPAPATPSNFSTNLDKNIDGEIFLSWEKNTDNAVGYRIYRDTNETGSYNRKVFDGKELKFTDKDVVVGTNYETTYYYVITAYNKDGKESERSAPIKANSKNFSPPDIPTSIKAKGSGLKKPARVVLTWDHVKNTDLEGYYVFRSEQDGPIPTFNTADSVSGLLQPTTENSMSWSDKTIDVGKSYYYTVVAADKGGLQSKNPASMRVNAMALSPVELDSPADEGDTAKLKFSWKKVTGAIGYVLVVQTQEFGGTVLHRSKLTSEVSLTLDLGDKITKDETYYWFVYAYSETPADETKEDGNSVSKIRSFTYKP